jgi:2-polyprenyl-3-methyl-5-hydroxy-6-metoxy-1,4-benzoquinol methylase
VTSPTRDRVSEVLRHVRGDRVLDIGCVGQNPMVGTNSGLHERLAERFPRVVGVDRHIDNTRWMAWRGYRWLVVGDAERLPRRGRFDTIEAGEVIEHLANPGAFLESARRLLAAGGRIVVSTPYPFSLLNTLYAFTKFPRTCENPEHACWFCPRTMTVLAGRANLSVVRWELVEDYDSARGSRRYRWFTRAVRRLPWLFPRRLRCNAMVFVLADAHDT